MALRKRKIHNADPSNKVTEIYTASSDRWMFAATIIIWKISRNAKREKRFDSDEAVQYMDLILIPKIDDDYN